MKNAHVDCSILYYFSEPVDLRESAGFFVPFR